MWVTIGAAIFLFIAVFTGVPTATLTFRKKQSIPIANYFWTAVGVVGFVACMGWLN